MSKRIFLLLLKLYPARFRAEYGDSMLQIFEDRLASETGFLARVRLWMDLIVDTLVSVPKEHLRPARRTPVTPGGYRLSEEGVAEMVRRSHITQFRGFFVVIAFGFGLGWVGHAWRLPLSICYVLLAAMSLYTLRRSGAFKEYWRNFEITLLDDGLRQTAPGRPTSCLSRSEMILRKDQITSLLETPGLGIAVCTELPERGVMWIPAVLNGYQEVRARLASWAPIQVSQPSNTRPLHRIDPLWLIGLCPAALLIQSPYLALPLDVLLIVGVGFHMADTVRQRLPPIPPRLRRTVWVATRGIPVVLLLVLIAKAVLAIRSF